MSGDDWIKLLPGYIGALTGVFGTALALLGFDRWRKELFGKRQHEAAHRILIAAIKLEREFGEARIMFDQTTVQEIVRKVTEAAKELDLALLDGRVLWGEERLREPKKTVETLTRQMFAQMGQTLRDARLDTDPAKMLEARNFVYNVGDTDEWGKNFRGAIAKVEDKLSEFLPRGRSPGFLGLLLTDEALKTWRNIVHGDEEESDEAKH